MNIRENKRILKRMNGRKDIPSDFWNYDLNIITGFPVDRPHLPHQEEVRVKVLNKTKNESFR